jgi:hypothetical protein
MEASMRSSKKNMQDPSTRKRGNDAPWWNSRKKNAIDEQNFHERMQGGTVDKEIKE